MRIRALAMWFLLIVLLPEPTLAAQDASPAGVAPVGVHISKALVDTAIEPLGIADGTPEEPSGTWVVGWYEASGGLGGPGIPLLYAYREFRDVGPAAFYLLDQLVTGDVIEITGADRLVYRYQVASVDAHDVATTDLSVIFAPTGSENLMLFTNAPPYDPVSGYQTIVMVRATLLETAPVDAPPDGVSAPAATGCEMAPRSLAFPGGSIRPVVAPAGTREALGVGNGSVTEETTVSNIEQFVRREAGCDLAIRAAVTLPDGRVLALLGPPGAADLESLTADGGFAAITTDPARTTMEFAIFIPVDGGWQAEPVPWS